MLVECKSAEVVLLELLGLEYVAAVAVAVAGKEADKVEDKEVDKVEDNELVQVPDLKKSSYSVGH